MSPETLRLTGSQRPFETDRLEEWYASRDGHDDRLDLAIVERESGTVVGEAVLNELDAPNRACGFRILVIEERSYGRGFGTEATILTLRHAFERVGLHRVELQVFSFNPRARHVYEKVGFRLEGTRRDAIWLDGAFHDSHVMSMLESEWRERDGVAE